MNRDYPLAPTVFGDKETRMKKREERKRESEKSKYRCGYVKKPMVWGEPWV